LPSAPAAERAKRAPFTAAALTKRCKKENGMMQREINTFTYEPARLATWGAAVGRKCRNLLV
jgi:hypothetical protein